MIASFDQHATYRRGNLARLLAGVAAGGLVLCATPGRAQDAPAGTAATPQPAPILSTPSAQSGAQGAEPIPQASDPAAADPAAAIGEDIVVTGTLLRGIAPTGTNVVGVARDAITITGAANSNDVLARVPQVSNQFNTLPTPGADIGLPINRPNIRNLGASGGSTTLVLVNGFRVVGQGILQTSPDPSIIPPGILDRVDVIPDGGSSIYGSDAIGGVINFITRRRFDGVEAVARYGLGKSGYDAFDGNLTAGRDWGSGSFVISYAYARHDDVLGRQRDFITQDHRAQGSTDQRAFTCAPGNVVAGGVRYALPGLAVGANSCDLARAINFYPEEERHSVYASLTQDLSDRITFNATAYFARRETTTIGFGNTNTTGLNGSGTIRNTNPYFRPVAGETSQSVAFSYAGLATGRLGRSYAKLDSYGVTPGFDIKIGSDWRVRASANFGRSFTGIDGYRVNAAATGAALAGTTTATALNPYNLSATDPAVLATIFDYHDSGRATQEIGEGRLVADGALFALPGGDVRVAAGGEFHYEDITAITTLGRIGTNDGFARGFVDRNVASVFGEVFVPLFGPANGFAGMQSLDLSASVRYDHYDDVGGTTNPKFGLTYRPFDALKIRGNWGTSFHAPSLSDFGGSVDSRAQILGSSPFRAGNALPGDAARSTVLLAGGNPDLRPETATTWSVGADLTPAFLPGLTLSGTYWNVDFRNSISLSLQAFGTGAGLFANPAAQPYITLNPTQAQVNAATAGLRLDGATSIASLYANGASPYLLLDARRANFGEIRQDGLDFNAAYKQTTGFGAVNASIGGTYILNRKQAATASAAFVDALRNGTGRLSFVGALGAKAGPLNAQATVNYSDSYPILGDATITDIDSFTTLNLFFSYDLAQTGLLAGTALTLNIDNVLDQAPPYANDFDGVAFTNLGRLFTIGIRAKF